MRWAARWSAVWRASSVPRPQVSNRFKAVSKMWMVGIIASRTATAS